MAKAPSSSQYQSQLQQMYQQSQQQLASQQAAYTAQLAKDQQAALSFVNAQQAQIGANVSNAINQKPVSLATILTSPSGALGNPPLAMTKLS